MVAAVAIDGDVGDVDVATVAAVTAVDTVAAGCGQSASPKIFVREVFDFIAPAWSKISLQYNKSVYLGTS